MLGKEAVMKTKYRTLKNLFFLQIKKDNEEILIINKKYKKMLECPNEQTSNHTKK